MFEVCKNWNWKWNFLILASPWMIGRHYRMSSDFLPSLCFFLSSTQHTPIVFHVLPHQCLSPPVTKARSTDIRGPLADLGSDC